MQNPKTVPCEMHVSSPEGVTHTSCTHFLGRCCPFLPLSMPLLQQPGRNSSGLYTSLYICFSLFT